MLAFALHRAFALCRAASLAAPRVAARCGISTFFGGSFRKRLNVDHLHLRLGCCRWHEIFGRYFVTSKGRDWHGGGFRFGWWGVFGKVSRSFWLRDGFLWRCFGHRLFHWNLDWDSRWLGLSCLSCSLRSCRLDRSFFRCWGLRWSSFGDRFLRHWLGGRSFLWDLFWRLLGSSFRLWCCLRGCIGDGRFFDWRFLGWSRGLLHSFSSWLSNFHFWCGKRRFLGGSHRGTFRLRRWCCLFRR
jgi:hypothetical protein